MMKAVLFILMFIIIQSCVKIEDGSYVPGSMPYSLDMANEYKFNNHISVAAYCEYDSSIKSDYVYKQKKYNNPNGLFKKQLTFMKTNPLGHSYDQVNFVEGKFPGLIDAIMLPCTYDCNQNGSKDWFFYLQFKDSILFLGYDSLTYKDSGWVFYEYSNCKEHYIRILSVWDEPISNTRRIVLNKSNRRRLHNLNLDTLMIFNFDSLKFTLKQPCAYELQGLGEIYQNDSLLFLQTRDHQNNLRYETFDDYHQYLLVFNRNNELIWADTISGPEKSFIYGHFDFALNNHYIFSNKVLTDSAGLKKKFICKYNKSNGEILSVKLNEHDLVPFSIKEDKLLCYNRDANILAMTDLNLNLLQKNELINFSGLNINHYFIDVFEYNHGRAYGEQYADINNDSITEFFITTSKKQCVLIDGKTLKPLLASEKYNSEPAYCFIREHGKTTKILIASKYKIKIFDIVETSSFTLLSVYQKEIIFVIIICIIFPIAFFSFKRIQFLRVLFQLLSSKSGSVGVIIFDAKFKIKSMNKLAGEILLNKTNPEKLNDIHSLKKFIKHFKNKAYSNIVDYNYLSESQKYLTLNCSIINAKANKTYFLLTINDITNAINDQKRKNELKTAVGVAHGLKTPLGTILLRFEVLQNMVLNNYTEPEIQKSKELILKNIDLSRDTIRQISYIAKEMSELPKDNYSLKELLENWVENYSPRYNNYNIDIRASLSDNLPELRLNPKSIELLLLTACDNSMQAMPKSRENKFIEFRLEQNKGNVQFSIIDNGSGMSSETLKKVQENTGYTSKATGSGLGMQLVRKVCEEHEAELNFESDFEIGTTMKIKFNINGESNE